MTAVELNTSTLPSSFISNKCPKPLDALVDSSGYLSKAYQLKPLPSVPSDCISKKGDLLKTEILIVSSKGVQIGKTSLGRIIELIKKNGRPVNIWLAGSAVYKILGQPFFDRLAEENGWEKTPFQDFELADIDIRVEFDSKASSSQFGNIFLDSLKELFPSLDLFQFQNEGFESYLYVKKEGLFNLSIGNRKNFHVDFVAYHKLLREHLFIKDALQYSLIHDTLYSDLDSPLQAPVDHIRRVIHADRIETIDKHGWPVLQSLRLKGYLVPEAIDTHLLRTRKGAEIALLLCNGKKHIQGFSHESLWITASLHLVTLLTDQEMQNFWLGLTPPTPLSNAIVNHKIPFFHVLSYLQLKKKFPGNPDYKLLSGSPFKAKLDELFEEKIALEDEILHAIITHPDRDLCLKKIKSIDLIKRNFHFLMNADVLLAFNLLKEFHLPDLWPFLLPRLIEKGLLQEAESAFLEMEEEKRKDFAPLLVHELSHLPAADLFKRYREYLPPETHLEWVEKLDPLFLIQEFNTFTPLCREKILLKIGPYLEAKSIDQLKKPPYDALPVETIQKLVLKKLEEAVLKPDLKAQVHLFQALPVSEITSRLSETGFRTLLNSNTNDARQFLLDARISPHMLSRDLLIKELLTHFKTEPRSFAYDLILLALDVDIPQACHMLVQIANSESLPKKLLQKIDEKRVELVRESQNPFGMANLLRFYQATPFPLNEYFKTHPVPVAYIPWIVKEWLGSGPLSSIELDILLMQEDLILYYKSLEKRIPQTYALDQALHYQIKSNKFGMALKLGLTRPSLIDPNFWKCLRGAHSCRNERFEAMKQIPPPPEEWIFLLREFNRSEPSAGSLMEYVYVKVFPSSPYQKEIFQALLERQADCLLYHTIALSNTHETERFLLAINKNVSHTHLKSLKPASLSKECEQAYVLYCLRRNIPLQEALFFLNRTPSSLADQVAGYEIDPFLKAECLAFIDSMRAARFILNELDRSKSEKIDQLAQKIILKLLEKETLESIELAKHLHYLTLSDTHLTALLLAGSKYPSLFDFCLASLTRIVKESDQTPIIHQLFDSIISQLDASEIGGNIKFNALFLEILKCLVEREGSEILNLEEIVRQQNEFLRTDPQAISCMIPSNFDPEYSLRYVQFHIDYAQKLLLTSTPSKERYLHTFHVLHAIIKQNCPLKHLVKPLLTRFFLWIAVSEDPWHTQHEEKCKVLYEIALKNQFFIDLSTLYQWRAIVFNNVSSNLIHEKSTPLEVLEQGFLILYPPVEMDELIAIQSEQVNRLIGYNNPYAYMQAWKLVKSYQDGLTMELNHTPLACLYPLLLEELPKYGDLPIGERTFSFWALRILIPNEFVLGHPLDLEGLKIANSLIQKYLIALYKIFEKTKQGLKELKLDLIFTLKQAFLGGGFSYNIDSYFQQITLAIEVCYADLQEEESELIYEGFIDLILNLPHSVKLKTSLSDHQVKILHFWIHTLYDYKRRRELNQFMHLWLMSTYLRALFDEYPTSKKSILACLPMRVR